jgi:hypothetical protein
LECQSYTLYNLFSFMIAYLEMEHGLSAGKVPSLLPFPQAF